jgi:hypothetical protein
MQMKRQNAAEENRSLLRKTATAILPLLLLVFGVCQGASASTLLVVSADNQGRYLNPVNFIDEYGPASGYAGVFLATLNGSTTYPVFCVDLYTDINPGVDYNVDVYAPNDPSVVDFSSNLPQAAWLYNTYLPQVNAASDSNVYGAALQLAIWDVVLDGGDGLTSGVFQLDPTVTDPTQIAAYNLAASMITASQGQSSLNAAILMNVAGPSGAQTLITSADALGETPEPSTLVLIGVGILGVGMLKRRRV